MPSGFTVTISAEILVSDCCEYAKQGVAKKIVIKKKSDLKNNRCLRGQLNVPSLQEQLEEFKEFYGN